MTLAVEEIKRRVDAYFECGEDNTLAAERLGVDRRGIDYAVKLAARKGWIVCDHPQEVLPGFEISRISRNIINGDCTGEQFTQVPEKSEREYIPLPNFLLKERSTLVDGNGIVRSQWMKEAIGARDHAEMIEAIKEEFEEYRGRAELVEPPEDALDDLLVVYPVVDPHIGMLSWGKQTGVPNDLKIGIDRMHQGAAQLIAMSPPAHTGVIINTGDFFHADDQRNATPAHGHQLDVDGRADKVRYAGIGLLRRMIDMALAKHKVVIVKNLRGNHDPESAGWLNIALGMFYENEPRVVIDASDGNNDIWLYLFGKNYIGATHGHTMKPERMAMVMADDRPDYWGASEHRWMIFGHIHHESVKEVGSVRCESFRQPTPRDAFAHSGGYRAGNSMSSITLHREEGEIGRYKINFPRRVLH